MIVDVERATWQPRIELRKYHTPAGEDIAGLDPVEVIVEEGNLLTTAGAAALLTLLSGGGGSAFNNANSYLGVGDSTTAAAVGQTDLQAATNKLRKAMDSGYPQVSAATVTWRATFGTSDANWAWQEWGVFNAAAAGTMLNRKVTSLGTKTSAATWQLTVSAAVA